MMKATGKKSSVVRHIDKAKKEPKIVNPLDSENSQKKAPEGSNSKFQFAENSELIKTNQSVIEENFIEQIEAVSAVPTLEFKAESSRLVLPNLEKVRTQSNKTTPSLESTVELNNKVGTDDGVSSDALFSIANKIISQQTLDNELENLPIFSITTNVYKAILSPIEFDNYMFWSLLKQYQVDDNLIGSIEQSAEAAGLSEHALADIRFEKNALVCYPFLKTWVYELYTRVSAEQFEEMKQCVCACGLFQHDSARQHIVDMFEHFKNKTLGEVYLINSSNNNNSPNYLFKPNYPSFIGSPNFVPLVSSSYSLWMRILSGFIMALGIIAVVTAFTVLNAAMLSTSGFVVAGLGVAAMLVGGYGLFRCSATPVVNAPSLINDYSPI